MSKVKEKTKTGWNISNSYINLPKIFFSNQNPTAVPSPEIIILNNSVADYLGLNYAALKSSDGVNILCGNSIPEGALPIAQAYAGHQFGHFTMLGDGRAVLLGEQITPLGERVDIQLKGSGRTIYSRGGDGKALLGPMLREYIISEAMYALGIPTSRSLAVVTTGETVTRENDGIGAVLTRVASSHIRIGTFQYALEWGNVEELKALADYTLRRHFKGFEDKENKYLFLLEEVIKNQALLIAKWQFVGFVHGVMNTDNMTISGETIDYGPCAFMDEYDLSTVFSSIDRGGRYAYGNQPHIAGWNLARFAESLLEILHEDKNKAIELAQNALLNFGKIYQDKWLEGMKRKLGIFNNELEDKFLIEELLNMMKKYNEDYTNTFRALTIEELKDIRMFEFAEFTEWYSKWKKRLDRQEEFKMESYKLMKSSNPAIIPRNFRVEEALQAAEKKGDYSVMKKLIYVLSNPFEYSNEHIEYSKLPDKSTEKYKTYCGT